MSKQKRDNPKTVVAMAAATVGGVSFAVWSISNSLAPPHPPAGPSAEVPAPAPQAASLVMSQPNAAADPQAEANLAMDVDPFAPLPTKVQPAVMPTLPPTLANAGTEAMPLPNLKVAPGGFLPTLPSGPANSKMAGPAAKAESAPVPELVGTLLGDRPCAVFRADKKLAIVPIGGRFGSWKVVSVSHGGVVVKDAHRTLRMGVGAEPSHSALTDGSPTHAALQARRYVPSPAITAFATDTLLGKTSEENPHAFQTPQKAVPPTEERPGSAGSAEEPVSAESD